MKEDGLGGGDGESFKEGKGKDGIRRGGVKGISDMGWRGKLERLEVDPIVMQLCYVCSYPLLIRRYGNLGMRH